MNTKDNTTPFTEKDVNWDELAAIGILRDELELSGELDALLRGEKTSVISMQLIPSGGRCGNGRYPSISTQGGKTRYLKSSGLTRRI